MQPKQVFNDLYYFRFLSTNILLNTEVLKDNNKLNKSAFQKPSTPNPSINLSHNIIIEALITNKNKPKVTKVIGIVKKINIGFKKVFSNANTTATIKAVVNVSTVIPGRKWANTKTSTVEINSLISKFII